MNERYSRQQLFAPIGEEGQKKIRGKHVVLVGAGA
ncbi:thiamine biosynthesis protein MoeB, partial [Anoxybacillus sp. LAT27]|nr:thiamine biosynthesis protein MoeB [Anoxybacillus sp. LAT27]